jgi:uncharacterized membrane protein YfcA
MWLIVPFLILLIFVLVGGALVGGIYADVLIPIVAIVLIGVFVGVIMRRPRRAGEPPQDPGTAGWPPSVGGGQGGADKPPEPTSPDDVVKERQGS